MKDAMSVKKNQKGGKKIQGTIKVGLPTKQLCPLPITQLIHNFNQGHYIIAYMQLHPQEEITKDIIFRI